jgi:pepF/M3 family oligoendopeptidase
MPEAAIDEQPTRWDMSTVYSSLEGDDYRQAVKRFEQQLAELESLFDRRGVTHSEDPPSEVTAAAETLSEALTRMNELLVLRDTLEAFIHAFFSTDSTDPLAAREKSRFEAIDAQRQKLTVRFKAWIGSFDATLDALLEGDAPFTSHAFFLRDTARQSQFLMSEDLESLAADLCRDGAVAFGMLQTKLTSQLEVPLEVDGRTQTLPIAQVHNYCYSADGELRRRAYEAEVSGWRTISTPVATCLNAIKGTAQTLEMRRGRASVLDAALESNRISRATLDALLGSIREKFPVFRRYLKSKAQKLGHTALPWWDLLAPMGAAPRTFTWAEARQFIVEKFATFSDDLASMADTAFESRWIDGQPRRGKAGGAFCMSVLGIEESRILANFDGSYEQVSTLAHELGHAYHVHCQKGLEPLRRGAPMTLAETASIFCETLLADSAKAQASKGEQLTILESQLLGATQVCLDISSRFLFESAVVQRRTEGELSADELCDLMHQAQGETYGDAVDAATYQPYMWLWKPHYYRYDENFYNFPYAFGHLFSLGLYGMYRNGEADFVNRYRALLRDTGLDDAATLASRFGVDITRPEFWLGSLAVIEQQVEHYEKISA